jgi:hypothetical protein
MATKPKPEHEQPAPEAAPPEAEAEAAPAPQAATPIWPTPTQHENDTFAAQQMTGTLPHWPHYHFPDGSPIDPQSYDPTPVTTPTWP